MKKNPRRLLMADLRQPVGEVVEDEFTWFVEREQPPNPANDDQLHPLLRLPPELVGNIIAFAVASLKDYCEVCLTCRHLAIQCEQPLIVAHTVAVATQEAREMRLLAEDNKTD